MKVQVSFFLLSYCSKKGRKKERMNEWKKERQKELGTIYNTTNRCVYCFFLVLFIRTRSIFGKTQLLILIYRASGNGKQLSLRLLQWLLSRSTTFLWTLFPLTDAELWALGSRYSLSSGLTCLLDQGHWLTFHLFQRHVDANCSAGSQGCPDF